ncbi:MAG TPA: autolysin [Candidatus Levilactobacillus faecigallinarum]|uniref:Autolysin n=1 Tax=Candidatus Levilactobacillus faecigallinarum TaxID=2838638 RepID=A0A9D1QQS8_9LACO|nr:autolysin [Candidatus Levilactobacillus faecigallinarum]
MSKIVIDVSGYQDSALSFFKTKKSQGAKSAIVKLTEETTYLNPKAGAQITNAYKTFDSVGAYHYFHGRGTAEAAYFLGWVKKMGLDKSTVLAIDVEDPGLPWATTSQVNVFLKYLISHGYKNVITYGPGSWFTSGRINRSQLVDKHIWVAAYGVNQPGVANANSWQFSSAWHGIDASYDFDGSLSGTKTKAKPKKASYWSDSGLFEVTAKVIYAYKGTDFKVKRRVHFKKGTTFYGDAVKYGSVYRIKTKMGYFTANKSMVKLVRKTK